MKRIVVYDIASPRRLRKVARLCEDHGFRIQKSVFECDLQDGQFDALWSELGQAILPAEDMIAAFPVCRTCGGMVRRCGITVVTGGVLCL